MHLQQTKDESRRSGGPQYYFHDLSEPVKAFLRSRGACPVVLQKPYGITESKFVAVGKDHKIAGDKVVAGRVGHDRIQQGEAAQSIGEEIRHWYGLDARRDFETIGIDVEIHEKGHFIVVPTSVRMRGSRRDQPLPKIVWPLSMHRDYQSRFWREEIERRRKSSPGDVLWAGAQIRRIVDEHRQTDAANIPESDLLRSAGALSHLGLDLSAHLGKGYDCPTSRFRFGALPIYVCPVELKKRSRGFDYQMARYPGLPRAVILCMQHDHRRLPDHIDVIELPTLADYLDG